MKNPITILASKTVQIAVASLLTGAVLIGTANAQQIQKRKFGPGFNSAPLNKRGPQAKKAPAEIIAKNGQWVVQCEARSKKADNTPPAKRNCAMIQVAKNKKRPKVAVSLIIGKIKQGNKTATMMRVIAPVGVFLPTGIALEVDGQAVGRVPFTRCLPQACMAFAEARKQTLAKMQKGNKARFLIYEAPGVSIPLELDLTGFTASLKALDEAS